VTHTHTHIDTQTDRHAHTQTSCRGQADTHAYTHTPLGGVFTETRISVIALNSAIRGRTTPVLEQGRAPTVEGIVLVRVDFIEIDVFAVSDVQILIKQSAAAICDLSGIHRLNCGHDLRLHLLEDFLTQILTNQRPTMFTV
jgi:hypothetical protein